MKKTILFAGLMGLMSFSSIAGHTLTWKSNGSLVNAQTQPQSKYVQGGEAPSTLAVTLPTGEDVALTGKIYIESTDAIALHRFTVKHHLPLLPHRVIENAFIIKVAAVELPKWLTLLSQQRFITTAEPSIKRQLSKK